MTVAIFDIAGAPLKETLMVAASNYKTVTHWERVDDSIIFYWTDPNRPNAVPLPGPAAVVDCDGLIRTALSTMKYPPEPDCDGHVAKSWRIRDHLPSDSYQPYVVFVLTPHWNEYHK